MAINDYSINTSLIISDLKRNRKDFSDDFITQAIEPSLEFNLINKGTRTFTLPTEEFFQSKYVVNKELYLNLEKEHNGFPIPQYFIYPERNGLMSLIDITNSCQLGKEDSDYDLFFALQLYQTDLLDLREFLDFHLRETFDSNKRTFNDFIECLFLKYDFFLTWKHRQIADKFFVRLDETITYVSHANSASITSFAYARDIEWYRDAQNIPNQKTVTATINFLDANPLPEISTLLCLNVVFKQKDKLYQLLDRPNEYIQHLKTVPVSERFKHRIYGLLLYWHGGFPASNLNDECDAILKLVQKEFLGYQEITPEKEFCKADSQLRNKWMKLTIAANTAINSGVGIETIYQALNTERVGGEVTFKNFNDLFEAAVINGALSLSADKSELLILRSRYNYQYNVWLQEDRGWEYGNEEQYESFLTKENFLAYLSHERRQNEKQAEHISKEKQSWNIDHRQEEIEPYSISWSSQNTITFRKQSIQFPFDCSQLAHHLTTLRPLLLDEHVCGTDIQAFPDLIFSAELRSHPDLSAWIYNIIETWVEDIEYNLHRGEKKRLFDGFLEGCRERAKSVMIDEKGELTKTYSVSTYGLLHAYLALAKGQAVTKQNQEDLALKYGFQSGQKLRNEFLKYSREDRRLDLSISNKRSAQTHLERFKSILSMLRQINQQAYELASNDMAHLEKLFSKYF